MSDGDQKRLTARKVLAEDLINGEYHTREGFQSNYIITPRGERVSRANLVGTVMVKFINDDGTYGFLVLDDESETVRGKFFQNMTLLEKVEEGDLVQMIGKAREYEGEIYVNPEIVRVVEDPNYMTLHLAEITRKLKDLKEARDRIEELKEEDPDNYKDKAADELGGETVRNILSSEELSVSEFDAGSSKEEEEKAGEVKSDVLEAIEELDEGKGASYQEITDSLDYDESVIEEVINDLLTDGTCFEPRPGKIKKL